MTIPKPTGQAHAWAIYINSLPYPVAMGKAGPVWETSRVPAIEGQSQGLQEVEREYRSGHSGYGWSQYVGPNTYHYAIGADLRFPSQLMCGPKITTILQSQKNTSVGVTGFFELGSYLYTLSGRYINRIDPATDTVTDNATFPYSSGGTGTLLTEAELFDGYAFIANSTLDYLLRLSGSTFTAMTNAPLGQRLAKWWSETDWVLGISYTAKSTTWLAWLAQNTDANVAANWTGFANSDYSVGDADGSITGFVASERTPCIARNDGLFYLDREGRAPLLVPAVPKDNNNGVNTIVDDSGQVWYPTKAGLYVRNLAEGRTEDVSPGRGLPDRSGIYGLKTAIAQFRSWFYVTVYDGTNSYLMAGRQREEGEPGFGSMIWHGALARFVGVKVTCMYISSLTDPPRLWFGLSSGHVAYMRLPANGDNPLSDTSYRFSDTATVYFPADDYGMQKGNLSSFAIQVEGMSTGSSVTVNISRDRAYTGSGGLIAELWTAIGSIDENGTLIVSTKGDKRFARCEFRLDIVNGSSTSTPVVKILTGRATRRPELKDVIHTTVLCYDEALSRYGIPSRYTGRYLADQLKDLDEYFPVTLVDSWTGKEQESTVLVSTGAERIVRQEGDTAGGLAIDVTMKILSTTGLMLAENGDVITTEAGVAIALE